MMISNCNNFVFRWPLCLGILLSVLVGLMSIDTHAANQTDNDTEKPVTIVEQIVAADESLAEHLETSDGSQAAQAQETQLRFELGRLLYLKSVESDSKEAKEATKRAEEIFDALQASDRSNMTWQAYRGSLILLEARRTWAFWKKGDLSKEAARLVDAAVQAEPANIEIRYVRGASTYRLPRWMDRYDESKADIAYIVAMLSSMDTIEPLLPRMAASAYEIRGNMKLEEYEAGKKLPEEERKLLKEDAVRAYRRSVEIGPKTPAGSRAADALAELGVDEKAED